MHNNWSLNPRGVLNSYKKLKNSPKFRVFDSIRFEYFLTFLKYADCIIGNSSAGIHEAGVYGTPTIDIGSRQSGRYNILELPNVQWTPENKIDIEKALNNIKTHRIRSTIYGTGNSTELFMQALKSENLWGQTVQKKFAILNEIMG